MLILSAADVHRALPMSRAIPAMKEAYAALSSGRAVVPLRSALEIDPHDAINLVMPAYVQGRSGESLAVKIVSIFPHNPAHNLPLIHAAVMVLEASTGEPIALLEGGTLTAIRTGAASGAATDILARKDSRVAAILGAGVQGRTQLKAICSVRSIQKVWLFDPNRQRSNAFIEDMAGKGPIPATILPASSPQQAVQNADIICTATTSTSPVFADNDIKPGTHINGIGSYTPAMQEIPSETVARAHVIVGSRTACLAEAGDLLQAIEQRKIKPEHIQAELGEVLLGKRPGRTSPAEITFFKSVGVAAQDAAAAQAALDTALAEGLGTHVDW